ncbi:uncharacterized protein GBIM_11094 [Gryllus bimaculatus]|nr:uncharacterized protein GBIM_11094 [Gryllus bimaculatus]
MDEKESGNQKKQSKKRARNPSEWKREKRKRLRIAGKEYVNSRGDVVNERKIGEDCKCRRKCYSLVPEDQRNKLFDGYYSLNSHDEQNAYLFGLIRKHDIARKRCKESDRRTCSYKYYVRIRGKEVQICRLAFAHIHGISPHKIRILCQKQDQNVMFPRDGRGKHSNRPRKIPEDTLSQIKDHIYSIISSDQVCGFLREEKHSGPDLNITKMWKDYLAKHDPNYKDMFSEKDEIDISKDANGMNIETECQLMADFTDAELTDEHHNHTYSTTMDLSEYPIASVADSLGLLDQPAESEFCTENETSSETLNKRKKYVPIVKHWLYSKVFHEEFKINDLTSFKKKSHMKELSKAPSNSQGSKSERKQRTPKKISREKDTCISMKVVEPDLPIDSVPPLVETPAADLQNINIGQSADMYILPVSLQDIAQIPPGPDSANQSQHALQFNLHTFSTQNNVLSPIVNVSGPTQGIQCSSVVTIPAGSVSFTQNSCEMFTSTTTSILTEETIHKFQNEGAVVLRGVFSPYWIQTVQKGIKKNLQNPSKYAQWLKTSESSGVYFNDYCNWKRISEFTEYIEKSPAAEIAARLTQSKEVRFFHEHVLEKSPGTEKQTPWHQDQPYYPINGSQVRI